MTLAVAADHPQPDLAARRNELYLAAVRRHGADPIPVDARMPAGAREEALRTMDGLLLSGGADIDPRLYGGEVDGALDIERERDRLEAAAWAAAEDRQVPVLGICRGLQAINVFSGGSLLQHVEGHAGAGWGTGDPAMHPLRIEHGTRLATVLAPAETLDVNAYHHQAIREQDLAPGLRAAAWADSTAGPLVEGLEGPGERFLVGIQCHPERTESTPVAFERLFAAFVAAAAKTRSPRP